MGVAPLARQYSLTPLFSLSSQNDFMEPPPYEKVINESATTINCPEPSGSRQPSSSNFMHCPHCGPGADSDHTLAQLRAGICPRKLYVPPPVIPQTFVYHGNGGSTQQTTSRSGSTSCAGLVLFKRGFSRLMILSLGILAVLGAIGYGIYQIALSPTHKFQVAAQSSDYLLFGQFAKVSFISQFAYFSFASQISICSVFSMISVCSVASMIAVLSGTSMLSVIVGKRAMLAFALWNNSSPPRLNGFTAHFGGGHATSHHHYGFDFDDHHHHHPNHSHNDWGDSGGGCDSGGGDGGGGDGGGDGGGGGGGD